ncbi:MAG: MFS transporter [Ruminococcaceae bacterium]|nr:MFS transporter [Oscillospiraceae bacterium]
MTKRTPYVALLVANALIYALNALYYNFIPIYLEHGGKTDDEIGYLLAAAQLVSAVAPFFWGIVTDKAKYKNNVLIFLVACATASFTAVCLGNSLIYLFIMLPLVMLFQNNYGGLIDTITVEASNTNKWKYGVLRVMGTLGFGLIAMVLAPFIEGDNITLVFAVYPVVGIVTMLSLGLSPKVEGHAEKKEKISLKPLFADRTMMMIFIVLAVALLTFNYYQNFYAKYLIAPVERGGLGIAEWVMGINVFLTVAGEIFFFIFYDLLMEKVGVKKLLWICVAVGTARYIGLIYAKSEIAIMLVAFFTGLVPTVVTYCATYYMMRTVAPNMRASGQMAMYALCGALPKILGSALGGELTQTIGTQGGLAVCALFNFITFIPLLFIPKIVYKE